MNRKAIIVASGYQLHDLKDVLADLKPTRAVYVNEGTSDGLPYPLDQLIYSAHTCAEARVPMVSVEGGDVLRIARSTEDHRESARQRLRTLLEGSIGLYNLCPCCRGPDKYREVEALFGSGRLFAAFNESVAAKPFGGSGNVNDSLHDYTSRHGHSGPGLAPGGPLQVYLIPHNGSDLEPATREAFGKVWRWEDVLETLEPERRELEALG